MNISNLLTFIWVISISNGCPGDDTNCQRCLGSTCLVCANTYVNQNGYCITPLTSIQNCVYYINSGVCQQCKYGYQLAASGVFCIQTSINNCLNLDVNGNCKFCNLQMLVNNNTCSPNKMCSINYCAVCAYKYGSEVCQHCAPGYTVITDVNYKTTCEPQYPAITNCRLAKFNEIGKCQECDLGYYWDGEQCYFSPTQTAGWGFQYNWLDIGAKVSLFIGVMFVFLL